jgi:hypothetical protein
VEVDLDTHIVAWRYEGRRAIDKADRLLVSPIVELD